MAADLKPTLERLKQERNRLLQYNKAKESVAHLERFCIAYDFTSSETFSVCVEAVSQCVFRKLNSTRAQIEEMQQRKIQLDDETAVLENRIKVSVVDVSDT